uniref:PB1-like domain-containing protein n=1 Tax=Lactuca sativa TaxID=4236 RepID=A0A9R1UWR1_LACSA|nr:hypothetical protein LSAT_V11C800442790 [Lactuca sativa]
MGDGHPTLFTIMLYHGGEFTKFLDMNYINGTMTYANMVDIEEFSIHEMDAIMKGILYSSSIYYHFRLPKGDMHFGLCSLGNDDDVRNLAQYMKEHKVIRVYTEHGMTKLLTYFMAPKPVKKVIIEKLDKIEEHETTTTDNQAGDRIDRRTSLVLHNDLVTTLIQAGIIGNEGALSLSYEYNRKRSWTKDKKLSSCSKKLAMDDVGEVNILQSNSEFHKGVNEEKEGEEVVNEVSDNIDMRDYEMDAKVEDDVDMGGYEMDVGIEDDVTHNVDMMDPTDENEKESDERNDEGEGSGNNDFWVDEENIIPAVEVDMKDFYMSVDLEAEFMEKRVTNPMHNDNDEDAKDPEYLDVIDNDQWDSMDEGSDMERKMRGLLKELGKETSKKELKEKIQLHALETIRNIFFKKNDKKRLRALYKGNITFNEGDVGEPTPYPWVIQGSRLTKGGSWMIKTYNHEHRCLHTRKVRSATAKFIGKQILDQVESNPTIPVKDLKEKLQKEYQVGFSIHQIFRAKSKAKKQVQGDYIKDYILELKSTNPDTTVKLEFKFEPNSSATSRRFRWGIYEGPFPRTDFNCSWGDDLNLYVNSNFTFISDRQNLYFIPLPGLQVAIAHLFPYVEHIYSIGQIHDNMKRTWRSSENKDHLWNYATTTTVQDFFAFDNISGRAISYMLLNNLCDVFNRKLIEGRDNPLITCLEYMREYIMKQICNVIKVKNKCVEPLNPSTTKIMEKNVNLTSQYTTM